MLDPRQLAMMQASVNRLMEQSIAIYRRTMGQGTTGNTTATYALVATVSGLLSQPSAGILANYNYLVGSLSAWAVRVPVGTDIRATDHLVVAGQTLEVQVILTPRSYPVAVRVLATEIQ